MLMATKRSAATKKAIRTRKLKSAGRKAAKKKRRTVARGAVAAKKLAAAAETPSAVVGQAVAPEEQRG
jgi:hypothetical protein